MIGFILQRVAQAALVVMAVSVIVFAGVHLIGNPVDIVIPPDATQEIREETIRRLGLDRPLWEQYLAFASGLLEGDFGRSFVYNEPVLEVIGARLPATLELVLISVVSATALGVALGLYAGYRPNGLLARAIMAFSVLGFSIPSFWAGLLLILSFAVFLGWLPPGGRGQTAAFLGVEWSFLTLDGLRHIALPAINLGLFKMAMMIRLTRAGAREAMMSDTVKFARAAGIREGVIVRQHVLRLISIPIVTVFGIELGATLAFAMVTETIFSWPGAGKLIIDSIAALDRPVMVAYLILTACLFVLINLIVDIVFVWLDPRLRERSGA